MQRFKITKVSHLADDKVFTVSANYEGTIDFAHPCTKNTYQLSVAQARRMVKALDRAIKDSL